MLGITGPEHGAFSRIAPGRLVILEQAEFSLQSSAKEVKPMKSLAPVRALGQRVTTTRAPTLARP
jgi:hypothetical protein